MKSSSLSDNNSKHPINTSFGHSLAMPQSFYPTEVTIENKLRHSNSGGNERFYGYYVNRRPSFV